MEGFVYIFVAIVAVATVPAVNAVEPKQVNLNLETVLKFNKKDRSSDLAIIDKVQNILEKIKDAVRSRGTRRRNEYDLTFSDFVLEAAKILKKYDDNDLQKAYAVIDDESRRYINKESRLRELLGNSNVVKFLTDKLNSIKNLSADTLRKHLNTAIKTVENDQRAGANNDILDIANTLYVGASDKFKTALRNLERSRRSNDVVLTQVLRNTLKTLIFDHYSSLDDNVKVELIDMIKHYLKVLISGTNVSFTKTKEVAPYNPKWSNEEDHKPKLSSVMQTRYKISKPPPSETLIKDKYKENKIAHEAPSKTQKKHGSFSDTDSKESTDSQDSGSASDNTKPQIEPIVNKKKYLENSDERKKNRNIKNEPKRDKLKYEIESSYSRESSDSSDESEESESTESDRFEVLTGGRSRHVFLRGGSSSEYNIKKPKEIIIQHSNVIDVGLSRKVPGRINASIVSEERYKTDNPRKSKIEAKDGRRQFTVFPATISDEGISIESFEDNNNYKLKIKRKSNLNDTLELDTQAKAPANVNTLIKNIEKQIEDVKEQVEYVKSLQIGAGEVRKPKFKSVDSGESFSKPKGESIENGPDSDNIDRDNEAFLSGGSVEKITETTKTVSSNKADYVNRAHDDTDITKYSAELKTQQNNTRQTVTESTTSTTTITTTIKVTVNNASTTTKDDNSKSDKLNKKELSDKRETHDVNATDGHTSDYLKANGKEHINTTESDNIKNEDIEKAFSTQLNLNFTTQNLADAIEDEDLFFTD